MNIYNSRRASTLTEIFLGKLPLFNLAKIKRHAEAIQLPVPKGITVANLWGKRIRKDFLV